MAFDPKTAKPNPLPGEFDPSTATPDDPSGLGRRLIGDTLVSAGKGVIGVGEAAVGLANLPTFGKAGKALEAIGYDPAASKAELDALYSPEQRLANSKVAAADGFVDTLSTMLDNPSTIAHTVVESVPSMLGGGAIGQAARKIATKLPAWAAGAIGEGSVGAGASAEGIRQQTDDGELTGKQVLAATVSGAGTGLIGAGGGKLAQKMGLADIDTALAQGGLPAAGNSGNIITRTAKGAAVEGVLQEMPQSAQEQAWQNYALDNPLGDGVGSAAAMGLLTGAGMGGGANIVRGKPADPLVQPTPTADNPAPAPVPRPDPDGGVLSRAANLLPAPGPVLGLPAPDTLYADAAGNVNQTGPNINVDGTVQPSVQGQAWVNPQNNPGAQGGPGMDQQAPTGPLGAAARQVADPLTGEVIELSRAGLNPGLEARVEDAQDAVFTELQRPALVDGRQDAYLADSQGNVQAGKMGNVPPANYVQGGRGMDSQAPTIAARQGQPVADDQPAAMPGSLQDMRADAFMADADGNVQAGKLANVPPANYVQGGPGMDQQAPSARTYKGLPAAKKALREASNPEALEVVKVGPQTFAVQVKGMPVESAPAPLPVLQNRDRTTPASITQMREIAASPDYTRLGFSRDFANGAPVVEPGANVPPARLGRTDIAATANGRKIPVQYAVVEADELLPSHDVNGSMVAGYEAGVPGKSRAIAGNGRVAGISHAYRQGSAGQYRQAIEGDDLHGINPAAIKGMKNPVLVRIMPQEEVTQGIGDESNTVGVSSMSDAERAMNDARRINIEGMEFNEAGDIDENLVRQFVQAMPKAEQGALLDGSRPSRTAHDRAASAIFASAYESDELIRLHAQATDPEARTVLSGLLVAAPKMAKLKGAGELDIRDLVVEAAETAVNARRAGQTLEDYAAQGDLDRSPEAQFVIELFARNIRSAKRIGEELSNLADLFYSEASKPENDLLGDVPKRNRQDMLGVADGTAEAEPADSQIAGQPAGAGNDAPGSSRAAADRPGQGAAEADQSADPFQLNTYSEAELAAQAAQQAEADAKAATEAKTAADKVQADRDRNDFTLSGSDRPADVAASRGQNDLFGPKTRGERKAEQAQPEWAQFPEGSGTLGIPRAEMPQIKAEHRGAMVNFLNARDIEHTELSLPATDLKPTQAEFSPKKVEAAKSFTGGDRSILTSSDGHVLDGHHQWLAKREAGEEVKVIRLDAPIRQLLETVAEFPSATTDQSSAAPPGEAESISPETKAAELDAQAFISAPDGSLDFGEITGDMAKAAGRQAGKIRLQQGNESWGLQHIEQRHGAEIRDAGFADVPAFVADIAQHIDQVWKPAATRQLVALHKVGNNRMMFVELQPGKDEAGDFYTVNTAFTSRKAEKKGWKLLWEARAQASGESGNRPSFAVSPPVAGGEVTNPSSQSSEPSIAPPAGDKPAAKPKSKPDAKLEDAGEKLGGARKDQLRTVRDRLDDMGDEEIAGSSLSQLWPKGELDKISDPFEAALYHVVRGLIPAKPRVSYRVKAWVGKVKAARDILTTLGGIGADATAEKMRAYSPGLGTVADQIEVLMALDRKHWGRIDNVRRATGRYNQDGEMVPGSWVNLNIDGRQVSFYGHESVASAIPAIKDRVEGKDAPEKRMKFAIYTDRQTSDVFVVKEGDAEMRRLKTFKSVKEARAFLNDEYEAAVALWDAVKNRDNVTKSDMRRSTNDPRVGQNHRDGKDVTSEQFLEAFGFRGVEFGNWVKQGAGGRDRQGMLNDAYDAFMDLASILNIPPKALSLEGKLGIGFGSRGSGKASAHYEPDLVVINMTKTKGAGSLAHEWFHALDNYFARRRAEQPGSEIAMTDRQTAFITYRPERLWVNKKYPSQQMTRSELSRYQANHPNAPLYAEGNWEPDQNHPKGVRPQVEKAFAELVETLNASPMLQRAKVIDGKTSDGYWSRIIERGARSFETYVIARLADRGFRNDYLANVQTLEQFSRDPGRYPYLTPDEQGPVNEAFDKLFATLETKETDQGVALFSRASGPIDPAGLSESSVVTGKVPENPISLEQAIAAAEQFLSDYNGNIELNYRIRKKQDELYGPGSIAKIGVVKGAYHPGRGLFTLASDHLSSAADAYETLRHEILGHYGLDTFSPQDKQALLDKILASKEEPSLKLIWDDIAVLYADKSQNVQAEEVFARLAESPRSGKEKLADLLHSILSRLLRKMFPAKKGVITRSELLREIEVISKGIRNGNRPRKTFDSETNLRRGAQTETPAFKRWFGDSKVVDANGEPMVVYHGTTADFTAFDRNETRTGVLGEGFYFSPEPERTRSYAGGSRFGGQGYAEGGSVMPVYVSLQNPLVLRAGQRADLSAESKGHDGVIQLDAGGGIETVVAFSPEQIKSATGNNGDFDPANPDIRYRLSDTNAKGIPLFSARAIAKRVMAATGLNATVVNTEADLPTELQAQIKRDKATGRVAGVYHNGTAYLVASNLRDTKHAISVMLHEAVGHGGVKSVLGDNIGKVMTGIYRDMPAAIRKELERRYASQIENLSEADANVLIAEEYVAHLAETDPQHSVINRLIALLRRFIRDTFGKSMDMKWTRNDIVQLLAEARVAARNNGRGPKGAGRYRETSPADALAALPEVDAADESAFVASLKAGAATRSFASALYKARGTESPFFKAWFGKSRMVDKQGQPIAFVHRSYGERDTFTDADLGKNTGTPTAALGHFLARKDVGNVERYGPVVEQFYIRMEKPKVITQAQFEAMGDWSLAQVQAYRKTLMEQGHDGLYIQGLAWPVVFEGKNIKARRNQGTFDATASTRYSLAQTATAAFKRWFGGSKVVDAEGKPLVVYHGTRTKGEAIESFDLQKAGSKTDSGWMGKGFYFGDQRTADAYAGHYEFNPDHYPEGGQVYPVYLSVQNPAVLMDSERNDGPRTMVRELLDLPDEATADQVREGLLAAGYDGVIYERFSPYGNGYKEYVAFRPEQIKSATGNNGNFDPSNPDIRYSLNDEADTAEALRKLGLGGRDADGIIEQIRNMTLGGLKAKLGEWSTRSEEGLFDGLVGIKRAEQAVGVNDPNRQGYVSARLASGLADVIHGVFHYGSPEWRDGIVQRKAGTRGVLEILAELGQDNLTPWLAWVGAKRAQMLKAEGRENNLSDQDIAELLGMAAGKEALFERVYREYAAINEAVLDLAEGAGLINPESREKWATEYYVPFYRQSEADGIFTGPRTKRGLSHQTAAIKQLKGGNVPTNDLLVNILSGWTKRIDASLKNKALLETVDNLKGTDYLTDEGMKWTRLVVPRAEVVKKIKGDRVALEYWAEQLGLDETAGHLEIAHELNKLNDKGYEELWGQVAPQDPDIIRVQRNGKNEFYRVNDESLLRGLKFIEGSTFNDPITRIGRTFKRVLTTGVTASPDFILRNFIRDAAHAWLINKDGFTLGKDSIKGMRDAFREDGDYRDLMFAGASFQGGYIHGGDPEASADMIRRALVKKGMSSSQRAAYMDSLVNTPAKVGAMMQTAWEKYRALGDKVENANRLGTYKAALAAGKSKRQAAYEAKDLMDFSLRGNFAAAQWFTDVVPFLNARAQGLYKLGRAMRGDNTLIAKEVAMKGAYVALFSLLLAGANGDDERYKALKDWDKDANWHFWFSDDQVEPFRIPKPFELGLIFGTVPERMLHAMTGNQDGGDLAKSVAHGVFHTLAFNPVPQFYQPIREIQANRNFFFDMPIEDMSDEGKLPEARYDERTSAIGRGLGQLTGPAMGLSPKQIDHLVRAYTGTLGGYVLSMSNLVAGIGDDAARPAATAGDIPVIKVLYSGEGVKSTQYQTEFYDMMQEAERLHKTIKAFREEGKVEEADQLAEENSGKLKHRRALGFARKQLGNVRNKMDAVYRDTTMDAAAKRERLNSLQKQANEIAKRVTELAGEDF